MTDDSARVFTSLLQVKDYLIGQGYKVSKSKIYRDAENGKITAVTDTAGNKSVSAIAAWEYAEKHLEKTGVNKGDLKNLQAQKLMNAIRNQDIEYKRKAFDLDREQGKYIPRADPSWRPGPRCWNRGSGTCSTCGSGNGSPRSTASRSGPRIFWRR